MGGVDCVVFPEASNVQSFLENFVETVDSTYGCVLLKGHVVGMVKKSIQKFLKLSNIFLEKRSTFFPSLWGYFVLFTIYVEFF